MGTLIALIWIHWVADFILQTSTMALNKSHSWKWLSSHVAVYTAPFLFFGIQFALINGVAHLATDAISSRLTTYFHKRNNTRMFFIVIGLDQAIHITTLVVSAQYLGLISFS